MVPEPPGPQERLNENDSTEAGEYRHDDHANTIMNQYYNLGVGAFGDDHRGEPNRLLEEILR